MRRSIRPVLAVIAVLAVWEIVCRTGLVPTVILPPPSVVLQAALTSGRDFAEGFAVTAGEILIACVLAWVSGVAFGCFAGTVWLAGAVAGPLLVSAFAVPLITWYPLFMTWFGIGAQSKIVYAAVSGFFPIAIGTLNGLRSTDAKSLLYARSVGCSQWQIVTRIMLPFALPAIVSGLRIGTGLTVIGVVVTEMLASTAGIGYLISYNRTMFNTGEVYLGILLTLVFSGVVNIGLNRVERRFAGWRELKR